MKVLGIDPGLSGAVALLDFDRFDLQVRRDFRSLGDIAAAVRELGPGSTFAVLELVAAMPGQGVTSMFTFGRATGVAIGALSTLGIPFVEIAPQRWQGRWKSLAGTHGEPFDSRALAKRVFAPPHVPATASIPAGIFDRKLDHGTADAALLAWYAASEVFCTGRLETSRAKDFRAVGSVGAITSVDRIRRGA